MPIIEATVVFLLGAFLLIRLRRGAHPSALFLQLLSITFAAWAADILAIRLYGLHAYTGEWTWWLDEIPAVVPFGWALLVLSGWDLARSLVRPHSKVLPWLAAALVMVDISVLGPMGTMVGAWQWSDASLFGISPILPLALAAFTGSCVAIWSLLDRRDLRYWYQALAIPGAIVVAHGAGWGGWALVQSVIPAHPILHLILAWFLAAPVAAFFFAEQWHERRLPETLSIRLVSAIACLVILITLAAEAPVYVVYCLATVMLYVSLTPWRRVFGRLQAAQLLRLPARLVARPQAEAAPAQRPRAA